jgi:hypothetical protein
MLCRGLACKEVREVGHFRKEVLGGKRIKVWGVANQSKETNHEPTLTA